jgi:Spy/CpxP family protein refolding chaperone
MTKLVVIVGFVLAFLAGAVVGRSVSQWSQPVQPVVQPPARSLDGEGRGGWFVRELKLTPEQAEQFEKIWREAGARRDGIGQKRRDVRRAREEAIKAIMARLSPEDRQKLDEIERTFYEQDRKLSDEERQVFAMGREQTLSILTPEQQKIYEGMMRRGEGERGRGPGRRPGDRATTRPAPVQ